MTELLTDIEDDILQILAKWKVLKIKEIHDVLENRFGLSYLCKIIKRLNCSGLIKYKNISNGRKAVLLTGQGMSQLNINDPHLLDDSTLIHDLISGSIGRSLLEKNCIREFYLGSEFKNIFDLKVGIDPDFVVEAKGQTVNGLYACEFERTQKSKERVFSKFIKYTFCEKFHGIIYFFGHEVIFKKYIEYFQEFKEDRLSKENIAVADKLFYFVLHDSWQNKSSNIDNSLCYYNKKQNSLGVVVK